MAIHLTKQIQLWKEQCQGGVISRKHDVSWPTRPFELTPLEYLWGYMKVRSLKQLIEWKDEVTTIVISKCLEDETSVKLQEAVICEILYINAIRDNPIKNKNK